MNSVCELAIPFEIPDETRCEETNNNNSISNHDDHALNLGAMPKILDVNRHASAAAIMMGNLNLGNEEICSGSSNEGEEEGGEPASNNGNGGNVWGVGKLSTCRKTREAVRGLVNSFGIDQVAPETKVVDVLCDDIAAKMGENEDAFYVVNLDVVLGKIREWQQRLPRVQPYFAIKCNPDPVIMSIMAQLGLGFDCASRGEVAEVLGLGVPHSRIIYANPCKQSSMLRYVSSVNVTRMTFDNVAELHKIKVHCPTAELILRIAVDDSHSTCKFNSKFGARQHDIPELLEVARQLGLKVIGVSFHVGSGCQSASVFPGAVRLAKSVFEMAAAYGFSMTLLDLGGGFPGHDYGEVTFEDIAEAIRPALDECFPAESGVYMIAEPGRYFVSESHTLATCVIAKRRFVEEGSAAAEEERAKAAAMGEEPTPEVAYYINDGVYGSFNCVFFDHAIVTPMILQAANADEAVLTPSKMFGPTCDSMDCVMPRVALPNLEIGDWLYFPNMGAYTRAAASAFNGFRIPTAHYTLSNDVVA